MDARVRACTICQLEGFGFDNWGVYNILLENVDPWRHGYRSWNL
jgi:hypothetical protein